MKLKVSQEVDQQTQDQIIAERWSDCVADLWEKYLPDKRREINDEEKCAYDPSTHRYGFPQGEHNNIENDGLEAAFSRENINEGIVPKGK